MIIIGSNAIKFWFSDFNRNPKDLDIILYNDEQLTSIYNPNNLKIEILENPILSKFCKNNMFQISEYLNPDILYTLKISHLFWNINWEKHMFDAQFLLKKKCVLQKKLFFELYNYWNEFHGKNKRSDLKMSAEDFFNNAIVFPIKHDDLHEILVQHNYFLNKIPTYKSVLKDGCDVEVCEEKFNNLNHDEKCNLVIEEVMVMAIERYRTLNYRVAYTTMLKKFIISHAPIWEAIFIIENYIELEKCPFNYTEFLNKHINN